MSASNSWGIGIVGLGVMGRRMAEALDAHPAFRVVAAFDPAPQAAAAAAHGLPLLASAEAVAAHPEVQCVYIASPPAWHRGPHAFTHIFSGGYSAGYYSYLWAEVLSADAFGAFEEAGVFDAATGARYRREILAVGGSRPALESFVAFRGREPMPDALLRSYGLAA